MSDPVLLLQAENVRLSRENALLRETNQRLTEEVQRLQVRLCAGLYYGPERTIHLVPGDTFALRVGDESDLRPDG